MTSFNNIVFFVFGCLVGSFLNVIIYRLPLKKSFVTPRSACPKCGNQLKWFHNIPILSFLFLRGRCAYCGTNVSWRYPVIELLTGLISLHLVPFEMTPENLMTFFFYFTIACVFICHFFIDLDHHLLLDSLNIYLLIMILPFMVITLHWQYWLIGAVIGFVGPLSVTWLFYKIRGQIGLGGGDIKLFGILGLILGPIGIVHNIFLSCLLGSIIGIILIASKKMDRSRPMAFGPYIIIAASFQIFFPQVYGSFENLIR